MFHSLFKKRDAYAVYLIMSGAEAFFFTLIFTVNLVYHVTVVRLDPLQLVLVGTLLEIVAFIFEVPTGIVADVYSRRLSVITGVFLVGAGFLIEGFFPYFGAILLAQLFWGLGVTFTSGATQAWIADEMGEERAGRAFLRGAQVGQIGALAAIPVSVALGSIRLALPVALGGGAFIALGLFLIATMPESGFTPVSASERQSWRTMRQTAQNGIRLVRGRHILLVFLGVAAFQGLFSEGFDRLWTAHFLKNFTFPALGDLKPVVWFGIINAASMLTSILTTEIVRRRVDTAHQGQVQRVLWAANALTVVGLIGFALAPGFWLALAAFWLAWTARGAGEPLLNTWINPHIESDVRATVFSMASQLNAIGQIAGGPGVGAIGKTWSLRAALVIGGVLLTPVLVLLGRPARLSSSALLGVEPAGD